VLHEVVTSSPELVVGAIFQRYRQIRGDQVSECVEPLREAGRLVYPQHLLVKLFRSTRFDIRAGPKA